MYHFPKHGSAEWGAFLTCLSGDVDGFVDGLKDVAQVLDGSTTDRYLVTATSLQFVLHGSSANASGAAVVSPVDVLGAANVLEKGNCPVYAALKNKDGAGPILEMCSSLMKRGAEDRVGDARLQSAVRYLSDSPLPERQGYV